MIRKTLLTLVVLLTGCSSNLIKPEQLEAPKKISCIYLPEPISYSEKVEKLFASANWEYRFERGPYIAEKIDSEGTYFRGPPGAIYIGRPEMKDEPAGILSHMVRDGGFWIPHDQSKSPKMYNYFSMDDAPIVVPDADTTCSSFGYLADPNTSKLNIVHFAAGGALGGVLGRAMVPNSQLSYGQSAAGGLIAGALIAAIINMDVGKIIMWESKDATFLSNLKSLGASANELVVINDKTSEELRINSEKK
jgi:hypothetical protein